LILETGYWILETCNPGPDLPASDRRLQADRYRRSGIGFASGDWRAGLKEVTFANFAPAVKRLTARVEVFL